MAFHTQRQGARPWTSFYPSHQARPDATRPARHQYGSMWTRFYGAGPGVGFHHQRPRHRDHVAYSNPHPPPEPFFALQSFPHCTFPETDVRRRYDAVEREFITPLERMRENGGEDVCECERERECGYAETLVDEEDGSNIEQSEKDVLAEPSESSPTCEVEEPPSPHASEHFKSLPHATDAALEKRWAALSEREASLSAREDALEKAAKQLELDEDEVMQREEEVRRLLEEMALEGGCRERKSKRQRFPLFAPAWSADVWREDVDRGDDWDGLDVGLMGHEWGNRVDGMSNGWGPYSREDRRLPCFPRWTHLSDAEGVSANHHLGRSSRS
jgi:hypothetical protein